MNTEYSAGSSSPLSSSTNVTRTMDLFPQEPIFSTLSDHQIIPRSGANKSAGPEIQRAKITMIYDGKVFLFDGVSPEKAEEIIFLAKQEGNSRVYSQDKQHTPHENHVAKKLSRSRNLETAPKLSVQSFLNNLSHEIAASMAEMSYAPIARRNSLHRFLEKRQDRWVSRGPYQTAPESLEAASRSKSWLGLAP